MGHLLALSLTGVTFATPWLLGALALGLPVLALYIWWRRRQKVHVSYLRIWERVARRQRHSFWRWLRWFVSLLIAVALVAAIVLAAAGIRDDDAPDPAPAPTPPGARRLIVLVDTSPSVVADQWSAAGSREWIVTRLRELAAAMDGPRGDTLDVILSDGAGGPRQLDLARTPEVLTDWQPGVVWQEPDWFTLAQMVLRVRAERTPADGSVRPEVVVITDGQVPTTAWMREQTADGGEVWRREAPGADDLVATVWRPGPAAAANVGIVNVELVPPAPAVPELARVTLVAERAGHPDTPVACELATDPSLGEPVVIEVAPGTPQVVTVPLPDRVPDEARRGVAGPHSWELVVRARAVDGPTAAADARTGDDRVALTLPLIEPVPVVVAGSGVRNPLIIPLMRLLEQQGVVRVVRSRDPRREGQRPVLMLLDDPPPGPLPDHSALLQFSHLSRHPGDLIRPGNLLEWSTAHSLFRVDDIVFVPLAVREARALEPLATTTVPLLTAPQGVVADYTPAAGGTSGGSAGAPTVPTVRVGFSLDPQTTDFLLQASLAPVLIKRLVRLLAPRVRPPVPPTAVIGRPLQVDFTEGSALAASQWPTGELTATLPTGPGGVTRRLPFPAPPLDLVAGMPTSRGQVELTARAPGRATAGWRVPVVLFDATESSLPPPVPDGNPSVPSVADVFPPADDPAGSDGSDGSGGQPGDGNGDQPRPLAEWLLFGAAALLVLEGLLYRLRLAE